MNREPTDARCAMADGPADRSPSRRRVLDPVLFGIGSVSVLGQVVLFREFMVAGYGVELICVLALGAWLLLTAAGVILGAVTRGPNLAVALFLAGLGVVAGMVFIRLLRDLTGLPPGTFLPLSIFIPAVMASLVPLCLFLGLAFQRAADQLAKYGHTLARAYAVECAGSVFGGLLSALMLHRGIQNLAQALVCLVMTMAMAILAVGHRPKNGRHPAWPAAMIWLGSGITLIVLMTGSHELDQAMTRWHHPDLLESLDSGYGRLTVTRNQGQSVLYQNDVLIADSQSFSAEELVHLSALQHPAPRKVLILDGVAEGLAALSAGHHPDHIDQIEIDPVLIALTRKYMTGDFPEPDAKVHIRTRLQDPRQYLRTPGTYDLILSGSTEPSTVLANRFFTGSFFRRCRKRLSDGGVLGFRLISSENYWSAALAYRNASIVAALCAEFPHILILPGSTNLVLASGSELVTDPGVLSARYRDRHLKTRLVTPPYITYVLSHDRRDEINQRLAGQAAPPNTDDRPVCYALTAWIWLSRLIPALTHQNLPDFIRAERQHEEIVGILIILGCGIGMNRLAVKKKLAYAAAGFAGFGAMVLESAMMLHYQTQSGALYQNMGILFMGFMIGMSAGAAATLNVLNRFQVRTLSRFQNGLLLLLPAVACLGWAGFLQNTPGLFPMAVLLAVAGFGVSVIFTRYAHEPGHPRSLYAADVAGAGIGALACGILFFPLMGLSRSVFLLAGMSIAASIGVALTGRRHF